MADQANRIMVIAAHPADPIERTSGTVAKHLSQGDEAMMVSLTTGVVTHAFNHFPATGEDKLADIEKIKEMKRQEFARATEVLGVKGVVLDLLESPLLFGLDEYVTVVELIREFRPNCVLCPHPVEYGRQDHMDCGRIVVAAVDYARAEGFPSPLAPHTVANIFMFYYQDFRSEQLMGSPRHAPEVIVDITSVIDKKREAMMAYASTQAKAGEDFEKKLDIFMVKVDGAAGFTHGFEYAEQFSRMNPERVQYLSLA